MEQRVPVLLNVYQVVVQKEYVQIEYNCDLEFQFCVINLRKNNA